jgi:hypothetical protein
VGESSNEPLDPFEAELATFRPRPMSPGLEPGIEARFVEPRRFWRIGAALLTFAAAACVVIGLVFPRSHDPKHGTNSVSIGTRPSPPLRGKTARAAAPPSVMEYQQAFAVSSDAFDALLARPAGSGSAPVRAFSFSSPDPITLTDIGDKK